MRSITVFTREAVTSDVLLQLLQESGGEKETYLDGIYFRRYSGEIETATIWVNLDTKVEPFYDDPEEVEDFRRTIDGFPQSEIAIRIIGADTREASTELAYQVSEKIIGTWGGCVYAPGFKPATEWFDKLPHLPWN